MIGALAATSTNTAGLTGWYYEIGRPFDWAMVHIAQVFSGFAPTQVIGAFGLAVIVVTLVIRTALFPVFQWQLRTARRVQAEQRRIAPALTELRKKYKKDPTKLNQEMQKLYKEHGINPLSSLSGCLPALVQLPILAGLYSGIRTAAIGLPNSEKGFLWIGDVSQSGLQACCTAAHNATNLGGIFTHPAVLILPIIAAGATFVQSRMMMAPYRPDMSDQEKQMQGVSKNMSLLFPVFIFALALGWPYGLAQGVALYWATQSLYMIVQQYYVIGWGAMPVPAWLPGAHRTTALSLPRASAPAPAPAPALTARSGRDRPPPPAAGAEARDGREQGETATRTAAGSRAPRPGGQAAAGSSRNGNRPGGRPVRRPPAQSGNRRRRRR